MGWRDKPAKDELAGDQAETNQRRFGAVVDRLQTNGQTKAANNVINGAGRGDSPEELNRRVEAARDRREGNER
ncbi:hypothetical protein [Kribbella sp. C-35]|uniref:hypothetical protein n=1 Tax=Kribbella sp. C-35 TaxID=2789276 RepID=UPI003977EC31